MVIVMTERSGRFWGGWRGKCCALLLVLGGGIGLFSYFTPRSPKVSHLFVELDADGSPFTRTAIQGIPCRLEINFGSKYPLALSKQLLTQLEKTEAGTTTLRNVKGDETECLTFYIKELKVGELKFKNILVLEKKISLDEQYGSMGQPLLSQQNLLLDFKNSAIVACNDKKVLPSLGYRLEEMTKIPFELGRTGIILSCKTDLGIKKLDLTTAANLSCLRQPAEQSEPPPTLTTSQLVIGGKDFGPQVLRFVYITPKLDEIDGFLGMDFLRRHVTYIDFENGLVYIRERE